MAARLDRLCRLGIRGRDDDDDESSGKKYKFRLLDVVQDLAVSLLVTGSLYSVPFIGMLCSHGFIWISDVCTEAVSWLAYRPIL